MKVLQIHTAYRQPGGEDAVVSAEAQLLRSAGHEVIQAIATNPSSALAAAKSLAVSSFNPSGRRLARHLAELHCPDIAHVHNTWFALSPAVLYGLKEIGVPTVMSVHNYRLICANGRLYRAGRPCEDCVSGSAWHGLQHRCYRHSIAASAAAVASVAYHRHETWANYVDQFLTPTDFTRQRLIAGGLPADRIRVKPHFVSDPGPRPAPPSKSRFVLFVGRLEEEKGVHRLMDAWESLGGTDLDLVILGDGPQSEVLSARRLPHVRFMGAVDSAEVTRWMLCARALVFPSQWYETFGLVVAEAMAAGLPVVTLRRGAASEVVCDAGIFAGNLGQAPDRSALVAALRRLEDDQLVDQLGVVARRRFNRHFAPNDGLSNLLSCYAEALKEKRAIQRTGSGDLNEGSLCER